MTKKPRNKKQPVQESMETLYLEAVSDEQERSLQASASMYGKHLEALADKANELGKSDESQNFKRETKRWQEETGDILVRNGQGQIAIPGWMQRGLALGLNLYLVRLRASKGILRALHESELVEAFEDKAVRLEGKFLAEVRGQRDLFENQPKPPKAGDASNLKLEADAEAEGTPEPVAVS